MEVRNNGPTLKMHSGKYQPIKEWFFNGNWGSSLLFKARTNSLDLNFRILRLNEGEEKFVRLVGGSR